MVDSKLQPDWDRRLTPQEMADRDEAEAVAAATRMRIRVLRVISWSVLAGLAGYRGYFSLWRESAEKEWICYYSLIPLAALMGLGLGLFSGQRPGRRVFAAALAGTLAIQELAFYCFNAAIYGLRWFGVLGGEQFVIVIVAIFGLMSWRLYVLEWRQAINDWELGGGTGAHSGGGQAAGDVSVPPGDPKAALPAQAPPRAATRRWVRLAATLGLCAPGYQMIRNMIAVSVASNPGQVKTWTGIYLSQLVCMAAVAVFLWLPRPRLRMVGAAGAVTVVLTWLNAITLKLCFDAYLLVHGISVGGFDAKADAMVNSTWVLVGLVAVVIALLVGRHEICEVYADRANLAPPEDDEDSGQPAAWDESKPPGAPGGNMDFRAS